MRRRYAISALTLVVAFSALSPALGGPAPTAIVAGSVKKLAKKALKKSKKAERKSRKAKRRGKRAKKLAKQNQAAIALLAAQGTAGPKGDPGPRGPKGDTGDPATNLWAVVADDGDLVRASDPTISSETAGGAGSFLVDFETDVSDCALVGTLGGGHTPGGQIAAAPGFDATTGYVETRDEDGTLTNKPFQLAALC